MLDMAPFASFKLTSQGVNASFVFTAILLGGWPLAW
jgi:hypothetical protein